MKKNEFEQFKTKSAEELRQILKDSREKLWNLKIDLASGKVKNVREIRKIKRDIARTMTLVNERA
ncbi:MAG: 50S ribosomal protein L29 [Candidatus Harrisonbacteria bacterium RIFCSPLOWO2_01_FULL_44_18]|uniref:Large ribosomal subunit protein uL29 n=1 Tax=Candidatus Harrisonbacteria bacterium RIFCSPLOWO2_01_FULL_44_18 TaxID=1798407 RepID=A0A1G1ZMX1_9BACT|nr:MAG: 50S ribosomal protein L29 [Candidatus Harrisonbacteria bacterium RIFCSPLOWO2_01_FULL_44_18]